MKFLVRKAHQYFWLLADQGVFAVTNFALNVQFARWLMPRDYGLFTVSFSGYLLLTVIHYGSLLEPLLVLSPQVDLARQRGYVRSLLLLHLMILAAVTVICAATYVICRAAGFDSVGLAVIGAGIGGSCLLMLLTSRRMCLVFLDASVSTLIGAVYFVGVLLTAYAYKRWWGIEWFDTWKIMGFWSLICSGVIFAILFRRLRSGDAYPMRRIFGFQKTYVPFSLVASICLWFGSEALYLVLAHRVGLAAVAQTRALSILINPLAQLTVAMNASWLIGFAAKRTEQPSLLMTALPFLSIFLMASVVFHFFGAQIMDVLYRGRYSDAAWELPLFCMSTCMTGLTTMIAGLFKTRGSLLKGTVPQVVIGLAGFGIGTQTIVWYGQPGVAFGFFGGNVIALALAILLAYANNTCSCAAAKL